VIKTFCLVAGQTLFLGPDIRSHKTVKEKEKPATGTKR